MNMTNRPTTPVLLWRPTHAASKNHGRFWGALGVLAIACLASIVVLRASSGVHVGIDLVANVSYFLALPLLGLFLAAACTRRWCVAGAACVAALVSASPLVSKTAPQMTGAGAGPTASVLHCNIRGSVTAWEDLTRIVDDREPDIVSVVEVSDDVMARIMADDRLLQDYPYRVFPRPGLEWTQVVLSRHPMQPLPSPEIKPGTRMQSLFSSHRSNVVSLPIGDIVFSTEHVPSPRNSASWKMGNEQIVALGHVVREHYRKLNLPIMLTGDFNTSPSGYRDGLMRRETGLLPAPETLPPTGTWPSTFPAFLRLPLDRVWASEEFAFGHGDVLRDVGSDHRPLYMRFTIRDEAATADK